MTTQRTPKFLKKAPAKTSKTALRGRIGETATAYAVKRKELARVKDELDEIGGVLLADMESLGTGKEVFPDVQVALVSPTRTTLNDASLKKKIGPTLWKQITTLVVDKRKLDAAIKAGDIPVVDVAMCSTDVATSPYVKVTVK